jgi:hypothetical protein
MFTLNLYSFIPRRDSNLFLKLINFVCAKPTWRLSIYWPIQGCQMIYFQTKIPNLGKFRNSLELKSSVHTYIQWPFELYDGLLVCFMAIWKFSCNLVYFPLFWYMYSARKNLVSLGRLIHWEELSRYATLGRALTSLGMFFKVLFNVSFQNGKM